MTKFQMTNRIIIASFFMFLFSFGIASACGRSGMESIVASSEKGDSSLRGTYSPSIMIDTEKYPNNVEVYVNNKKIEKVEPGKDGRIYYYFDQYAKWWFPESLAIRVEQDGNEIYSANWKIYDTTFSWSEKILPILLFLASFVTLVLIVWGFIANLVGKRRVTSFAIFVSIGIDFLIGLLLIFSGSIC